MAPLFATLAFKLLVLAGALATTAGVIGFFAFEDALGPHRWSLLIGGFAAIILGEGASSLIARRLRREAGTEDS